MAASKEPPIYTQAVNFVLDVANGRSVLSKFIPPALLALDVVLCGLVIWKIPCKQLPIPPYRAQEQAPDTFFLCPNYRYRDRLDDLYATHCPVCVRRTRLH